MANRNGVILFESDKNDLKEEEKEVEETNQCDVSEIPQLQEQKDTESSDERQHQPIRRTKTIREDREPPKQLVDAKGHVLPYVSFAKMDQIIQENQDLFDSFIARLKALKEHNNTLNHKDSTNLPDSLNLNSSSSQLPHAPANTPISPQIGDLPIKNSPI